MTNEQERTKVIEEALRLFYEEGIHDIAIYINAMSLHNWNFLACPDEDSFFRGQTSYMDLVVMRARLDPYNRIWNAVCPSGFEIAY